MSKDFGEWYNEGVDRGFITPFFCATHDGGYEYMTEEEVQEWEEGGDPCQFVVRLVDSN